MYIILTQTLRKGCQCILRMVHRSAAWRGCRRIVPRLLLCALLPAASTDTRASSMDQIGMEGNVGGRRSARVSAVPGEEHPRSRGRQTCSLPASCTGPHSVAMCLRGGGGHGKAKRGGGGTGKAEVGRGELKGSGRKKRRRRMINLLRLHTAQQGAVHAMMTAHACRA